MTDEVKFGKAESEFFLTQNFLDTKHFGHQLFLDQHFLAHVYLNTNLFLIEDHS